MKRLLTLGILGILAIPVFIPTLASASTSQAEACWGQVSAEFAQLEPGILGEHSSDPGLIDPGRPGRLGLKNLAAALVADGLIFDDTMADLGAFVKANSELAEEAIPACDGIVLPEPT